MTNFNYQMKWSEQPLAADEALKTAQLYKEVFVTPPWNEAFRCSGCGKSYGLDVGKACLDCGGGLEEYYDLNEVQQEILEVSRNVGFRIASVVNGGNNLVGFWWGWEGTLDDLNEQKLRLDPPQLGSIRELEKEQPYFYLSEFGVKPSCRGQNLGKRLFQSGIERIALPTIMRTNTNSPAFAIARQNGFSSIWSYPDQSYRVLLSKNI